MPSHDSYEPYDDDRYEQDGPEEDGPQPAPLSGPRRPRGPGGPGGEGARAGEAGEGPLPDGDSPFPRAPWADSARDAGWTPPLPPRRTRRRVKADDRRRQIPPEQRILILDAWARSGLPAKDFAALVGVASGTLYQWRTRFRTEGPAGLATRRKRAKGVSRLPDATKLSLIHI